MGKMFVVAIFVSAEQNNVKNVNNLISQGKDKYIMGYSFYIVSCY